MKVEAICRVCQHAEKVTKLMFIPTEFKKGAAGPFPSLQIEIHLICGHMIVLQVPTMPLGV